MVDTILLPLVYSFFLAFLGWRVALILRIPAPAMIGPMLIIAGAAIIGLPLFQLDSLLRIGIQSIIGGYIGRRINKTAVQSLVTLLPAIAMTSSWYILATAFIGYLVARWAFIDLPSAYLATAPGGVAEMTALAITSGADVAFVATFQTLRVLMSNLIIPIIARWTPEPGTFEQTSPLPNPDGSKAKLPEKSVHWLGTVFVGLCGSWIFTLLNIPAGGILGAMVGISLLQLNNVQVMSVPKPLLTFVYMALGISVGASFSLDTLIRLQDSLWVLIGATLATLMSSILLSFIVMKTMKLDLRTSLLACSPGGLALMAVVAEETGAQAVVVGMLHLVRIVLVVASMPVFLYLFF